MFPARALGHFNERSLRCDWCRALRVFASFGKTLVLFMFRFFETTKCLWRATEPNKSDWVVM